MMDPIVCPECGVEEWRCVERGRYDEYLYFSTGEFGDRMQYAEHDEYDSERDTWFCINDHEAPPEIQDEIESRVEDAEYA